MIALQNLIPMLVDADDAFIVALEAHLRAHPNRTSPAPEAVSIGGPFSDEERAEIAAKLEELQAMPAQLEAAQARITELEDVVKADGTRIGELEQSLAESEGRATKLADELEAARQPAPAPHPQDGGNG